MEHCMERWGEVLQWVRLALGHIFKKIKKKTKNEEEGKEKKFLKYTPYEHLYGISPL